MRSLQILILSYLCLFSKASPAQILEKRVNLNYNNVRLATVLVAIKTQYHVGFSYANNLIPLDKKVSVSVKDKPLGQALNDLFQETGVTYTLVGDQIVLKRGVIPRIKSKPIKKAAPSGKPSAPSSNATPGNPNGDEEKPMEPTADATASLLPLPTLSSETSEGKPLDETELRKEYQSEQRNLLKNYLAQTDAAMNYQDSAMSSQLKREFKRLKNNLKGEFKELKKYAKKRNWDSLFVSSKKDSLRNTDPVQVSFVPPLSTNGKNNEYSVNRFSLNILAGYSGGLDGVEVGGIANIEKENAKGVQVAGTVNLVRKDVNGFQVAGTVNANGGNLEGAQVAGFLNASASDSSNAVQVAGFGNIHKGDLLGAQVSGYINVNGGYVIGPQVAGFMNIAKGPVAGVQAAGFMNINSGNLRGVQAAGFMNVASQNTIGTQVAGFMNITRKDIEGVQVAGFMNQARKVRGSQIGVINFADSISGVQIGFLNFCRNGYRRLEVFGSDAIQANLAFKMGSKKFHNIFAVGISEPQQAKPRLSYGYGFGSEFRLGNKFDMNLDLICNQIKENGKLWTDNLNLLNQLKVNFALHPGKRTSLFAGPVLHVAVSKVLNKESNVVGSNIVPDWAPFDKTYTNTRVAIWPGFNAGIRF